MLRYKRNENNGMFNEESHILEDFFFDREKIISLLKTKEYPTTTLQL